MTKEHLNRLTHLKLGWCRIRTAWCAFDSRHRIRVPDTVIYIFCGPRCTCKQLNKHFELHLFQLQQTTLEGEKKQKLIVYWLWDLAFSERNRISTNPPASGTYLLEMHHRLVKQSQVSSRNTEFFYYKLTWNKMQQLMGIQSQVNSKEEMNKLNRTQKMITK